jgi:hypothetical protein
MANYSLVVNSKFQPFSFDRYLQPYQIYGQNYKEIEEQYTDLSTKAGIWDGLANEQTDPYTYKMYKTYANDLENQASQLASEGLNAVSRKNMLNMRARYSKEIIPIEQAYKARTEEAAEQYKGRAAGMVYEGDASTASLDRYLNNPSIRFNQANSQEGFKRVATTASALSKGLRDYRNGKRLDPYVKTWLQEHGYKDTDVAKAINDIQRLINGDTNVDTNGVLNSILQDELNVSGVGKWSDKAAVMDYFSRVAPALYQAVGQTQVSPYEDYGAKLSAQEAMQRRLKALDNPTPTLNYKPRTFSHLEANGALYGMKQTRDKLNVQGKGLKASYFGKRGNYNPLEVYEEYKKMTGAIRPGRGTELYQAQYGVVKPWSEVENDAMSALKKKYGNDIKVISDEDYNTLKTMGYTNKSSLEDFKNMDNMIDASVKSYTEYFMNGDPEYLSEVLTHNISNQENWEKSFAENATILDKNFNKTSKKFNPEDYGTEDNPIVDFSHSTKHRNKVIVSYKDGSKVAFNPDLISGEMGNLFRLYDRRIKELMSEGFTEKEAEDYGEMFIMEGISSMGLSGYNQSLTKTSSKVGDK